MTRVKICGIRTLEAAIEAERGGADYIGFIFYPKSHRYIKPADAAKIAQNIIKCKKVGVFVDEQVTIVNEISERVNLDYVQLHGHEDEDYAKKINRPIIKAWRYGDGFNVEDANKFPCELILLDSFIKGKAGGTGQTFNWNAAAEETKKLKKPVLIAGGISVDNVSEVIKIFSPFGVDVSGSLEINGIKSIDKIQKFLKFIIDN